MATTFGDRKAAAPPRKGKPKKKLEEDEEGAFQDVVALDIPRKVLAGPFRIVLPLHGRRGRTPGPVIKPAAKED